MAGLDKESEEFKGLSAIVSSGKDVLTQFDQQTAAAGDSARELKTEVKGTGDEMRKFGGATEQAGESTISLRRQITLGRQELVKLEEAGKGASKEYFELEKRVAELTDAFGDQQNRIKVLASDTRALDFGKAAITSAINAFQVYASLTVLVGEENEDLQKKTMQLFAAMQLLTSLEQVLAQVQRGGVLITNAQAAAQAAYTAVVGASTGALRAFRLALAATGVGAAIVGIGFLIKKYIDYRDAVKKVNEVQLATKEITESVIRSVTSEVVHLDTIRQKLTDLNIPQKERIALAKEYNKTADESNQIDLKSIDNIALVNKAIDSQIAKIRERAQAKASENIITQRSEALQLAEEAARDKSISFQEKLEKDQAEIDKRDQQRRITIQNNAVKDGSVFKKIEDAAKIRNKVAEFIRNDPAVVAAQEKLNAALEASKKFITIGGLTGPPPPAKTSSTKEIENEFAKKKAELDAKLAELTRKEADNESKIRIEFAARLAKEQLEIDKLFKEKKLTAPQRDILKAENVQINTVELEKALADFRKKITDARQKLNDELQDLQSKALQDSINLIQDDFDRRAKLIEFNEQKELDDARKANEKRLAALDLDRALIGEEEFQKAKAIIITNGEQQAINILKKFAQERKDLAADTFEQILDAYRSAIDIADTVRDKGVADQIKNVSDRFLAGKISYQKFQKEITKIQRDSDAIRRAANLQTLKDELKQTEDQIIKIGDTDEKQSRKLKARREKSLKDINDLDKEGGVKNINDLKTASDERMKQITDYANVIGELVQSVISFWQKANEAEAAALDKSIQIQEKRVEAAQRIAERGNASYLKEEEDKLRELTIKRENAARRELAINAALQASQLLVGITGAIAKIANPFTGTAETIGAIATIFAALATGYGLVKSLQGNQPQLAEGTTYLQRGKNPPGKDTIPAWLNEGEAIIPTERNKNYKKSVEAIYHGKVPADEMNRFVENYVNKGVKNETTQNIVYDTTNQNLSTYKNFVSNVSNVPANVLNSFITNYQKAQYFKGTTELKRISEPIGKDTIPIMAHEGEAIIPTAINKLYQPTIKAVFDQNIPAEKINQFVREFHTIKPLPIPHYEKIKESAEMKISHDGRLAGLISEQNRMLAENNDLQRTTIRALKSMGVNVNVDRNGLALSVMEVAEKIKIDSKT